MQASSARDEGFRYPLRWLLGLSGLFAAVHAVYYALGVTFNRDTLIAVMHFLDAELLRERLLESIYYLHIQPPLMNLFAGLVLKITPESAWLFQAIFLALGLALYLSVFVLQLRMGAGKKTAALLSTLFMASPSFLLWENFLLYTMPCAALLAVASVLLFHVIEGGARWAIAGFFTALFLVCGMRGMFHLGYLIIVLAAMAALCKGRRRRVLLIGMAPLLLLFSFYLKNFLVFGEFNTCTFVEKNLWIMTAGNLGDAKSELIRSGELSELSWVNRWASLDAYPPKYKQVPARFAGIAALDATHKSNGEVNYNHYGNIAICNIYGEDAAYVLLHYPKAYLNAMRLSCYRYFISSSALPVSPGNQAKIPWMIEIYDYAVYGKCPVDLAGVSRLVKEGGRPPYLFLLLGLPLVFAHALYRALRPGPAPRRLSTAQRSFLLFACFNIALVFLLGCAFDFLETARYRFMTDGLSVVLLGFLAHALPGRRRVNLGGDESL